MSAEEIILSDGYVRVGVHQAVADANGNRPLKTPDGELRPTEFELHTGTELEKYALKVDPQTPVKVRRLVEGTLTQLFTQANVMATVSTQSWENALQVIVARTIKGVKRLEDGAEITDENKLRDFFENHVEFDDILPILATIKHELTLQRAKKKSSISLFG